MDSDGKVDLRHFCRAYNTIKTLVRVKGRQRTGDRHTDTNMRLQTKTQDTDTLNNYIEQTRMTQDTWSQAPTTQDRAHNSPAWQIRRSRTNLALEHAVRQPYSAFSIALPCGEDSHMVSELGLWALSIGQCPWSWIVWTGCANGDPMSAPPLSCSSAPTPAHIHRLPQDCLSLGYPQTNTHDAARQPA